MKKVLYEHTSVKDRQIELTSLRNLKMARSAHAYVRGNTAKFYEWLAGKAELTVPEGPPVWICGDCHVGNLGPIANAKGKIQIEIRDLDQTVIGNPAHDLIRLGLSLASAARGSDLPGIMTSKMMEQLIEGYEAAFSKEEESGDMPMPEAVEAAMRHAIGRKWKQLAQERIKGASPSIPLGKHFWPLTKAERAAVADLFNEEKTRRLVTSLRFRDDDASIEVLDAAFWVKGCSSLGNLRIAVLVRVGGSKGELCLMDIKEAVDPLAPKYGDVAMPRNNGERVVQGAWHLSPALGDRMINAELLGKTIFLRELLPQDLKFEIEHLTPEEGTKVAKFLAHIVGKAHARQMDADSRAKWLSELKRKRSKTLDAPSWLWTSVVDLVMMHEGAYLDHCRKYALLETG
ncbi:DUF2252 family protein [Asticcacaulis sp. 201]|uniref:DUF2252 family protein n=1 Tax=Asticcacaulis sp. 201 TaxID=3028787 RepID=UPI00291693C8|nr:DUF2252 family protein [Asticcacaulis sp. 201]MDV6330813.1 DUF2252 family protein [Asticcacaulis sp. 201]